MIISLLDLAHSHCSCLMRELLKRLSMVSVVLTDEVAVNLKGQLDLDTRLDLVPFAVLTKISTSTSSMLKLQEKELESLVSGGFQELK